MSVVGILIVTAALGSVVKLIMQRRQEEIVLAKLSPDEAKAYLDSLRENVWMSWVIGGAIFVGLAVVATIWLRSL